MRLAGPARRRSKQRLCSAVHRLLANSGVVLKVPAGEVLFQQGSPPDRILLLRAGEVRQFTCNVQGWVVMSEVVLPGDCLGITAVVAGVPYEATATALSECELISVPRDRFMRSLCSDTQLCCEVVEVLGCRLDFAYRNVCVCRGQE